MLMEFDKADWPVEDKEWLKSRKAQWKDVENRWMIANVSFCKRKEMPLYRQFFLTGELDLQSFYRTSGCTFTLMLLHPKQTYEQLLTFFHAIDDVVDMDKTKRDYALARDMSIRAAQGDVCVELGKEGLFYGLDAIYAKVFYGERCGPREKLDKFGKKMPDYLWTANPDWIFEVFIRDAAFFMLGITQYPYSIQQYMAEYWYSSIPHNKTPFGELKDLPMFLQAIYYFDKFDVNDGVAGRRLLAEELKNILDTRALPDELTALWDKTKTAEGRRFNRLNKMRKDFMVKVDSP